MVSWNVLLYHVDIQLNLALVEVQNKRSHEKQCCCKDILISFCQWSLVKWTGDMTAWEAHSGDVIENFNSLDWLTITPNWQDFVDVYSKNIQPVIRNLLNEFFSNEICYQFSSITHFI